MQLLKKIQIAAAAGGSTLLPEAVAELTTAILYRRQKGGAFCGLDGKPDLYYSFFARMSLDALDAEYDRHALTDWLKGIRSSASGVDRVCAELMLLQERQRSRVISFLFLLGSLFHIGAADSYKLFLTAFLMEELLPPKLCSFLINRAAVSTLRRRELVDFDNLSTPRAAVCALLAHSAGDQSMLQRMRKLLRWRRIASGGYASAAGAKADLLSTAVVAFVLKIVLSEEAPSKPEDLAFIELCWQDDRLFSSAPDQSDGDLEHTFFGLLALGSL